MLDGELRAERSVAYPAGHDGPFSDGLVALLQSLGDVGIEPDEIDTSCGTG